MSLVQLVYLSQGNQAFSNDDLEDILVVARENNKSLNVTGLLIYMDGMFMQCLEGPKDNVESLYHKISMDSRHSRIQRLLQVETERRIFSSWEMGFTQINDDELQEMGFVDAKQLLKDIEKGKQAPLVFMKSILEKNSV